MESELEELNRLKKKLRKTQNERRIVTIMVKGRLAILSKLLDIDSPDILDEVQEVWSDLRERVELGYETKPLLRILEEEKSLTYELEQYSHLKREGALNE